MEVRGADSSSARTRECRPGQDTLFLGDFTQLDKIKNLQPILTQ